MPVEDCSCAQLGCTQTNSSMYVEWPSGPSTGRAEQLRGQEYTTMVPLCAAGGVAGGGGKET